MQSDDEVVEAVADLQLAAFLAGRGSVKTKRDGVTVVSLPYLSMDIFRDMARAAITVHDTALKQQVETLREEVRRLSDGIGLAMTAKHQEADEAKLWFTKAQEWKQELNALKQQVEALREAMKPFADEADKYDPEQEDGDEEAFASHFLLMDLRRARAALAATEPANGR